MSPEAGLRERKKQLTREVIFESARRLFSERGFDAVTVAEVAREADVSDVTVFNYFSTKEDLFFGGMLFFEERLIEAVRQRPAGVSASRAFARAVLESSPRLAEDDSAEVIAQAGRVIGASPALQVREREIVARYAASLAAELAVETGAGGGDVESIAVAAALMWTHRALVEHVRKQIAAGLRGRKLARDFESQAARAFTRLDAGLAGYAVTRRRVAAAHVSGQPSGR